MSPSSSSFAACVGAALAGAAAHELFRTAGVWEVRVLDSNQPAQRFWRATIEQYTRGHFKVEPWTRDDGSEWQVFRFSAPGARAA